MDEEKNGKVFDNRHRDIDDLQAIVKEQQTLINEQQDCIDTLKACINHMEDTMMPHCQISQTHINKIEQQSALARKDSIVVVVLMIWTRCIGYLNDIDVRVRRHN